MRFEQYLVNENRITDTVSLVLKGLKKEGMDTKQMMSTFFNELKYRLSLTKTKPTDNDLKMALEQMKDIGRLGTIATLMAISTLTIPVVEKIANHYNTTIIPDGFRRA